MNHELNLDGNPRKKIDAFAGRKAIPSPALRQFLDEDPPRSNLIVGRFWLRNDRAIVNLAARPEAEPLDG